MARRPCRVFVIQIAILSVFLTLPGSSSLAETNLPATAPPAPLLFPQDPQIPLGEKHNWIQMVAIVSRLDGSVLVLPPAGFEAEAPAGFIAPPSNNLPYRCSSIPNASPVQWTLPPFHTFGPDGRRMVFLSSTPGETQRMASALEETLPSTCPGETLKVSEFQSASGNWTIHKTVLCAGSQKYRLDTAATKRAPNREIRIMAFSPLSDGPLDQPVPVLTKLLDSITWLIPTDPAALTKFDDVLCNYALSLKSDGRILKNAAALVEKYPDFPLAHALNAALLLNFDKAKDALAAAKTGMDRQPQSTALTRLTYEAALRAWDPTTLEKLAPKVQALFPRDLYLFTTAGMTADITGDGAPDILRFEPNFGRMEQYDGVNHKLIWQSSAFGSITPFYSSLRRGYWPSLDGPHLGPIMTDINGDGLEDLIYTDQFRFPREIIALDRKTGIEMWHHPLGGRVRDAKDISLRGGRLLVLERKSPASNPPTPAKTLLALDPKTGGLIWKQELDFSQIPQNDQPETFRDLVIPSDFSFSWPGRPTSLQHRGGMLIHQQPPYFRTMAEPAKRVEPSLVSDTRFFALEDRLFIAGSQRLTALKLSDGSPLWEWPYQIPDRLGNLILTPGPGSIQLASLSGELSERLFLARLNPDNGQVLLKGLVILPVPKPPQVKDVVKRPFERLIATFFDFATLTKNLDHVPEGASVR